MVGARRVAVVGASGNVGTALLRELVADPGVEQVLGLSRRRPHGAPYDDVDWATCDVAVLDDPAARDQLVEALTGCDSVVHLAWAIQPNTRRDLLRRTNVDGTRHVLAAAARAGARQVVVASSVAAYSPSPGSQPRQESFATGGVRTSHYSVDKAAQERVLDAFAVARPDIAVARMRTSLVFQADAGAEVARLFVGPLVPLRPLLARPLPVLPLPRRLRLQATRADDVARAYALVLRESASGAFNVAADPVLTGADLADLLGRGRLVEIPAAAIRPLLHLAWRARLVAADPGWLDMAMAAPVLDTSRIRGLGWAARASAQEAVLDVVTGMRERAGTGSPALRPGSRTLDAGDRPR